MATPANEVDDLTHEVVKKDYIYVFMVPGFGDRYSLNYILGANSGEEVAEDAEPREHLFGRFYVSHENLLKIRRNLLILKTNFTNSSQLSDQKKTRDLKYLNDDYIKILIDISSELMRGKSKIFFFNFNLFLEIYTERKNVENTINKELLGEISLENIEFWFNMISGSPFISWNMKFNEFLQDIHKKLF